MYKYYKTALHPFPKVLHVYIGKDSKIVNDLQRRFYYNLLDELEFVTAGIFDEMEGGNYLIYVESTKYLLHEVTHAIDALMEFLETDSQEFRAYWIDSLYTELKNNKIYKIMNRRKK